MRRWQREIQSLPFQYALKGAILEARGLVQEAIGVYRRGVELLGGDFMLGMADELLFHLVRALVLTGRREETGDPLESLRTVAKGRPNSEAFLSWAEGLLAEDPGDGALQLRASVETFRRLGRRIDEARCLMDLAELLGASGRDGSGEAEEARRILTACGVVVYLRAPRPPRSSDVPSK
jgi:hypothetical protein